MCGTGRFLLPLLEEGFNVHGFDASDDMLEALHTKAKAQNAETLNMEMLKSAGFKHIRTLKAFDQSSQPANQDESIVYECRK